ncbi:MAG: helix-hairpin-helix domain-containing protein [Bacteroidetes bacterium]|nr:helix-hairpin-helix domain-containing protein [Bacteroidota bacterium]
MEEKTSKTFEYANPETSFTANKLTPFPFNPNMLSEEDWKKIGLSERQIKGIKNYEARGGKFFRKEDVKKMYTISEAEYAILEPFIVIPTPEVSKIKAEKEEKKKVYETTFENPKALFDEVFELNTADSLQLIQIPGVGPWTSHRILQYRNILGGFYDKNQLYEVHGFDSLRYDQIEKHLVIDSLLINKIRINYFTFKELIRHPYIDYALTKTLVNHREKRGFVKSFDELGKLEGYTTETIKKLRPYVRFD